jgi:hypothetical protein
MNRKAIVPLALLVIGSWLALKLTRDHSRFQLAIHREAKISTIRKDIEKITDSIGNSIDGSATMANLRNVTDILQLEGQIRDLQTKNDIELSKSHESTFPEFLPILLFVALLVQNGMLLKQVNNLKQNKPGAVTSPAKTKTEVRYHLSAGLETVFDYCPDCGAGDIVPDKDGKCTNCGYNLAKEVLENSKAAVACKESPASDMC